MKRQLRKQVSQLGFITGFVILAAAGCGDDGDDNDEGAGLRFTTSAPGNEPLGGLSESEFATLCADGNAFAAKLEADSAFDSARCRTSAVVFAAFGASESAADSELRANCSRAFTQCMNAPPEPEPTQGAPDACEPAEASCTATVAEYTQCINDGVAQTRELAAALPDCATLTRADLEKLDIGFQSALAESPASCQVVQAKCSGVSEGAQAFIDEYCGLVDSCCTATGREGACEPRAMLGAQEGTFDESAAAACLAELRQRQGEADYCTTLVATDAQRAWAVSAECARVFESGETAAPGEDCDEDSDCAPGANGGAVCLYTISSAGDSIRTCVATSGRAGDEPCVGTTSKLFGTTSFSDPLSGDVLCDSDQGVVCVATTRRCAHPALAAPCEIEDDCDVQSSYCDFESNTCAARLPVGARCTGTALAECAGSASCNETTKMCKALGGAGAPCSTASFVSECISYCDAGTCLDPLSTLCF